MNLFKREKKSCSCTDLEIRMNVLEQYIDVLMSGGQNNKALAKSKFTPSDRQEFLTENGFSYRSNVTGVINRIHLCNKLQEIYPCVKQVNSDVDDIFYKEFALHYKDILNDIGHAYGFQSQFGMMNIKSQDIVFGVFLIRAMCSHKKVTLKHFHIQLHTLETYIYRHKLVCTQPSAVILMFITHCQYFEQNLTKELIESFLNGSMQQELDNFAHEVSANISEEVK